ncbi:peptidoglycan-binding protein, partial [Fusicatenibacter saccharivorans]|nr:peptidoglycan-binding protein [Fusicatenibacter saccharivorans]
VEQLMGQMKVLKLDSVVRDIVRIKNVVTLPKTKPNICKLISSLVDMRNLEYTYERDHITLTGECHACIVYLSEEQEICCFEVQEGFSNE